MWVIPVSLEKCIRLINVAGTACGDVGESIDIRAKHDHDRHLPWVTPFLRQNALQTLNKHDAGNDFIPSLSLGLIRDYKTVVLNLCHERGLPERIIAKVLGVFPAGSQSYEDSAAVDELWFWALQKTLRADMRSEKLYPAGTV